ncbi:hypothetical protein BURPS305_7861 [Burkholderia pseudomallei 305]|nr:hypothetical protein BURPS305_7861 [Burkholderia pseudomallei 305]
MHPSIEQRCPFYKNVDGARFSPVVIRASNAHHLRTSHRRTPRADSRQRSHPGHPYSKNPSAARKRRIRRRARRHIVHPAAARTHR